MLRSKFKGKKLAEIELELSEYTGDDEIILSTEMAEQLKEQEKNKSIFSFSTGISHMDRILDNVEAGELIIVTGPTGSGKTSLLMTLTKNMEKNNIASAWFEFELTMRQFFSKFDFNPPLFYLPKNNVDNKIDWLEERILESIVKYDVKVVYIDDLHHLFSLAKMQGNLSFEIGDIIAKLKDIAVYNNLVIFIQAHLKDPQDSTTREPKMNDIRDSGLIKAFADTVMGIWRVPNDEFNEKGRRPRIREIEETDTKSKVRIWKNRRNGILSSFYLGMKNKFFEDIYDKDGYIQ